MTRASPVIPMLIAVFLVACPEPSPVNTSDTDSPSTSVVDSSDTSAIDSATTEPIWPYPEPWLEGGEWLPDRDAELFIANIPPNSIARFFLSEVGFEHRSCASPGPEGCLALVEPILLGQATADADSMARWSAAVSSLLPLPRVLYFQAEVTDPATGATTLSTPIQRHLSLIGSDATIRFSDVSQVSGVSGIFTTGNSHTGGVAWPDFNGDHFPDLFISNGGGTEHRLFRNNGNGTFTDVSALIRKPSRALETAAVHFADIDNDGDVDLFAVVDSAEPMDSEALQPLEGGPNLLYVNQGDGTFIEEAGLRGLVDPRGWRTISAAFADFNADGFVDVHLSVWAMNQPTSTPRDSRLLLNDGTGRFAEQGPSVGYGRDVLTSMAADLDLDGWPDLYLGHVNGINGFHGLNALADDVIYRNHGGSLLDVTDASDGLGDDAWAAMGLDIADIDNDGDFDIYETDRWEVDDTLPRGNTLYLQNDDGSFTDNVCDVAGVCTSYAGWPTLFADFDNDGWSDLYVGTGKDYYPDLLYHNEGDGTFRSHWVQTMQSSPVRGGAQADFDADGEVDFAVWQYNAPFRLFRNTAASPGHWIEVELVGPSDPLAIGAVIRALGTDGVHQLRRVSGGDSAHSQSSNIQHFGLGNRTQPVSIDVIWPGGATQRVTDLPVDRFSLVDSQGIVPQSLVQASAVYDPAASTVEVTVQARYGGRRGLRVNTTNMVWSAVDNQHRATLVAPSQPASVSVVDGASGQSFVVPVSGM